MTRISWGAKVSPQFLNIVMKMCDGFGWTPAQYSHLMTCMAFESGHTFSPSVRNMAGSGATGLIQFMPETAKGLNTTTDDLAKMTAEQQLFYVKQYFKPYAKKIKLLSDMYMAILYPKYIPMDENKVLFTQGTVAYRQNAGFDVNKNGVITKYEATAKVNATLLFGFEKGYYAEVP